MTGPADEGDGGIGRIGLDQDLSTRHASEVGLLRREDLNLKEYRVTRHRKVKLNS